MLPPSNGLALIARMSAVRRLRPEGACSLPVLGGDGGSSTRLPGGVTLGDGGVPFISSFVDMKSDGTNGFACSERIDLEGVDRRVATRDGKARAYTSSGMLI